MEGLTQEGAFGGDFGTPEQQIPATGLPGVDWETCMTMNDHFRIIYPSITTKSNNHSERPVFPRWQASEWHRCP